MGHGINFRKWMCILMDPDSFTVFFPLLDTLTIKNKQRVKERRVKERTFQI